MGFYIETIKEIKTFNAEDGSKWSKKLVVVKMGPTKEEAKVYLNYGRFYDNGFRGIVNLDADAVKAISENMNEIKKLMGV